MKYLVFIALLALATAQRRAPAPAGGEVTILRQELDNPGDGTYSFAYETSDGTKHEESGSLRNNPDPKEPAFITSQGSYSYTAPEGEQIELQYIADENGFQPSGAHLPTPPPIPPQIQRSLDIIGGFNSQPARRPASRPSPPQRG